MDILSEKYKLIEWLISLDDESIISEIKQIKSNSPSEGKIYSPSDAENLSIEAGLKDIEESRTFSHEDVMREVKEKYGL